MKLRHVGDRLVGPSPASGVVVLVVALAIIATNAIVPLMQDDLCRVLSGFSLAAAINSVIGEYWGFTGRIPALVLTYPVVNDTLARVLFVLANSAILVGVMLWLPRYHDGALPEGWTIWNTLLVWVLLCGTSQGFGYVAFFVTGAIQYLWSLALALVVLAPFLRLWFGRPLALGPWLAAGHVGLAFVLGMWTEHLSAGLVVGIGAGLGWLSLRRCRVPFALWLAYGALVAGAAVLIAAPGNYIRLGAAPVSSPEYPALFLALNWSFFVGVALKYLVLVGFGVAVLPSAYRGFDWRAALHDAFPYLVLSWLIAMAMIGARYGEVSFSRAIYSEVFFLIAFIRFMRPLRWPEGWPAVAPIAAAALVVLIVQQSFYWTLWWQVRERLALVEAERARGVSEISVPAWRWFGVLDTGDTIQFSGGPVDATDIAADPTRYHNLCAARYYGVASIRADRRDTKQP